MSLLDRIKKLEERIKNFRIIDTEDIFGVDTGLGIELHLEDPTVDEGEDLAGFKAVKVDETHYTYVNPRDENHAGQVMIDGFLKDVQKTTVTVAETGFVILLKDHIAAPKIVFVPYTQGLGTHNAILLSYIEVADGKSTLTEKYRGTPTGTSKALGCTANIQPDGKTLHMSFKGPRWINNKFLRINSQDFILTEGWGYIYLVINEDGYFFFKKSSEIDQQQYPDQVYLEILYYGMENGLVKFITSWTAGHIEHVHTWGAC